MECVLQSRCQLFLLKWRELCHFREWRDSPVNLPTGWAASNIVTWKDSGPRAACKGKIWPIDWKNWSSSMVEPLWAALYSHSHGSVGGGGSLQRFWVLLERSPYSSSGSYHVTNQKLVSFLWGKKCENKTMGGAASYPHPGGKQREHINNLL